MGKEYLKISDLNNYIKRKLDDDLFLNKVYLKGEISNFKNHTRGHLYFTLKDDSSRISAVMFQSSAIKLSFVPEDGMNVLVEGRISAYPSQGSYQIYIEKMEPDGLGALYIEYEKLKKKLAGEGLFNNEHKKIIPRFPEKIGVITASTGAAVRDIMSTIRRRYPICEAILFPCLVQGKDAAPDIVRQIKRADEFGVDTIIVGRGGGSIEDMWAFNEEVVAHAIYECKTPIISAVGHEIDWTIADFVADLRAPTPTGAAEMAVPTVLDINTLLNNYKIRLNKNIKNMVNTKFIKWRSLKNSFVLKNPMSMYEIKEQKLDNLMDNLDKVINKILDNTKIRLYTVKNSYVLNNPSMLYKYSSQRLDHIISKLEVLNPLNTLNRGYAIVKKEDKVLSSIKDVKEDEVITIAFKDGNIESKIIKVGE